MQIIHDLSRQILQEQEVQEKITTSQMDLSDSESYVERRIRMYNEIEGNLPGKRCDKCRNKGIISYLQNGEEYQKQCECVKSRRAAEKAAEYMKREGIDFIQTTFDNYFCLDEWQKSIKKLSQNYIAELLENNPNHKKWLFLCGQNGSGKTHLCTAASGALFNAGYTVSFFNWKALVQKLDSLRFSAEYENFMGEVQEAEVLFIDDLLKQKDKNRMPNDLNLAFEILDARARAKRVTVISSEWLMNDLINLDAGLAGRIKENSQLVQIAYADGRDWRTRKDR